MAAAGSWCGVLLLVLLAGCQPQPAARSQPKESVAVLWTPLSVSAEPVDRNVFLESIQPDWRAAALLVADRIGAIGEIAGPGSGFGLIPKQAVSWIDRDPRIARRVVIEARVVCRQGYLEHFLSQFEAGKDHESILSSSFDAQSIHVGLLACGLKPGQPARFFNDRREEDFRPPSGDPVRVDVEYLREGQWVRHRAQDWVVSQRSKKPLDKDWVFAGSFIGSFEDEEGKEHKFYAANSGRVICVTNFPAALLDLPFQSSQGSPEEGGLDFLANTEQLPEYGHRVRVILEPLHPPTPPR